jgi:hypothetical protein
MVIGTFTQQFRITISTAFLLARNAALMRCFFAALWADTESAGSHLMSVIHTD